jgi:hydrogenase maturation protease
MKTIIVGLGNPILGDDGVGWKVAQEVKKLLPSLPPALTDRNESFIDVEFLSLGGISLMEHLIGYDRAILIDAVTSEQEAGSVLPAKLTEMPDYSAFHITSVHDTSLQNAIRLGKSLGARLPDEVMVVGIATNRVFDFGEQLTPAVAAAIPRATKIVMDLL